MEFDKQALDRWITREPDWDDSDDQNYCVRCDALIEPGAVLCDRCDLASSGNDQ